MVKWNQIQGVRRCGRHQVQQLFEAGLTSDLEQFVRALSDQVFTKVKHYVTVNIPFCN